MQAEILQFGSNQFSSVQSGLVHTLRCYVCTADPPHHTCHVTAWYGSGYGMAMTMVCLGALPDLQKSAKPTPLRPGR